MAGAAAASIAAIVSIVLLNSGKPLLPIGVPVHGTAPSTRAGIERGAGNYDAAAVVRLAGRLARQEQQDEAVKSASGGATGSGAGTTTSNPTSQTTTSGPLSSSPFSALRSSPAACVRHAASLPRATKLIRPLIAARFQGTPVYIGAAVERGTIRVWVVARRTCSILFQTSRQLG